MERWGEIKSGLWVEIKGPEIERHIYETKSCDGCPFRSTVSGSKSYCLYGKVKILRTRPAEERLGCNRKRQTHKPNADIEEQVGNFADFSGDTVSSLFNNEWQWTLPGEDWLKIMGNKGRTKSRQGKVINYVSPEGFD